jgi:peptidoglycan/LPS O-acetylase OafA/YrhL
MIAWWASHSERPARWLLVIALLGGLALLTDFRGRLLVAVLVSLGLVWLQRSAWPARWLQQAWMLRLGQISYSVFLIHFPVCLMVNAVVSHLWPADLLANTLGLLTAFGLSLLAGEVLYRCVESPGARWRSWFRPALAAR